MRVVVDTNIIFSASLSVNSKFRELLFNSYYEFYAPATLLDEINRHIDKIFKYSKQSNYETLNFLNKVFDRIQFYKLELISNEIYAEAYKICKDYDENDTPFVALAMHLNAKLWTGDKIKIALKQNGFDNFL